MSSPFPSWTRYDKPDVTFCNPPETVFNRTRVRMAKYGFEQPECLGNNLKRLVTFAACAALLAACSPQKPAETVDANAKFNTDALPMTEFMGHVVDPASFAYWKGSGTEDTAKGTRDLTP